MIRVDQGRFHSGLGGQAAASSDLLQGEEDVVRLRLGIMWTCPVLPATSASVCVSGCVCLGVCVSGCVCAESGLLGLEIAFQALQRHCNHTHSPTLGLA